jgi:hypothetical protein
LKASVASRINVPGRRNRSRRAPHTQPDLLYPRLSAFHLRSSAFPALTSAASKALHNGRETRQNVTATAKEASMPKRSLAVTTAILALGAGAYSAQAAAQCDPVPGMVIGGGIGAAIGNAPGAAVGAIIGSAISASGPCYYGGYYGPRYYAPPPAAYYGAPPPVAYYEPAPVYYGRAYYGPGVVYRSYPRYGYGYRHAGYGGHYRHGYSYGHERHRHYGERRHPHG